jgi:hypothetical protein
VQKILYIDMDGVLVDFTSGLVRVPSDVQRAYEGREDEIPGISKASKPPSSQYRVPLQRSRRSSMASSLMASTIPGVADGRCRVAVRPCDGARPGCRFLGRRGPEGASRRQVGRRRVGAAVKVPAHGKSLARGHVNQTCDARPLLRLA